MQGLTLLGVDSGGTFTDFVLLRADGLQTHKVLSTPEAPERAILQGIHDLGLDGEALLLIHGTTVATNAVLQGKGVKTAYVTNRGFADVLSIGRQTRDDLYALEAAPKTPPVPAELCFELDARLAANGEELQALNSEQLKLLAQQLIESGVEAVAVNMLFSFLNSSQEQTIAAALPKELFASLSSQVLPQAKEYERGIATWLNASVGPLVGGYFTRLDKALNSNAEAPSQISIMQSSAGTIAAELAARRAVDLLLSGPAGGLVGARYIGSELGGEQQLLSFDMGGTSTDVALLDGEIRLSSEGRIADYPVAVPMVDMHTIGAGGGSIASIDAGGLLCVGPESAGAAPGPACYGKGGDRATVSDANLILGRLQASAFLGGRMQLDVAAAELVLQALAEKMGVGMQQAAAGVIQLVDEHMARALRVMSVQRGINPAKLTLTCFGGAGGLHVCSLADNLQMTRALLPIHAGVLSALGMLRAPKTRQLSQSVNQVLLQTDVDWLMQQYAQLEQSASSELMREAVPREQIRFRRQVDLRYRGQSYELCLDWQDKDTLLNAFHQLHKIRYGHQLDFAVEMVNLRLTASSPPLPIQLPEFSKGQAAAPSQWVDVYGYQDKVPLYQRQQLVRGQQVSGPALVCETASTTYIAANWRGEVDAWGNMLLTKE